MNEIMKRMDIFRLNLKFVILMLIILLLLILANRRLRINNNVTSSISKQLNIFSSNNFEQQLEDLKKSVVLNFHKRLSQSEFKVFSQNGDDGVLFGLINIFDLNQTNYYVEIGTQSGSECNTRYNN